MMAWSTRVAKVGVGQPVSVSGTLTFLIQNVGGAELFGLFMFLRIASAPAQYVTDSSFVEQCVKPTRLVLAGAPCPARRHMSGSPDCAHCFCETASGH